MGRQVIQIGTTANDGTGTTLRAGGDLINDNFNEIYSAFGDGSTIAFTISGVSNGQTLIYNSSSGQFEPGDAGGFTVAGDGGDNQSIVSGNTLTLAGGTGITTTGVNTDRVSFAIDATVATLTGSQTLTNKTLTSPVLNGSLSGTAFLDEDDFSSDSATAAASQQSIKAYIATQVSSVTASSTTTFTNKTFDADGTGNSITNIENADIKAAAGIEFSKMENLTASRALASDTNGDVSVTSVTSTELGYLSGVTSSIQDQLNAAGLAFAIALGGE